MCSKACGNVRRYTWTFFHAQENTILGFKIPQTEIYSKKESWLYLQNLTDAKEQAAHSAVKLNCTAVTRRMTTCSRNVAVLLIFGPQICTNGWLYNIDTFCCVFTLISFVERSPSLLTLACCSLFQLYRAPLASSVTNVLHFSPPGTQYQMQFREGVSWLQN